MNFLYKVKISYGPDVKLSAPRDKAKGTADTI